METVTKFPSENPETHTTILLPEDSGDRTAPGVVLTRASTGAPLPPRIVPGSADVEEESTIPRASPRTHRANTQGFFMAFVPFARNVPPVLGSNDRARVAPEAPAVPPDIRDTS